MDAVVYLQTMQPLNGWSDALSYPASSRCSTLQEVLWCSIACIRDCWCAGLLGLLCDVSSTPLASCITELKVPNHSCEIGHFLVQQMPLNWQKSWHCLESWITDRLCSSKILCHSNLSAKNFILRWWCWKVVLVCTDTQFTVSITVRSAVHIVRQHTTVNIKAMI